MAIRWEQTSDPFIQQFTKRPFAFHSNSDVNSGANDIATKENDIQLTSVKSNAYHPKQSCEH